MVNFNQTSGEKESKIAQLSTDLTMYKSKSEDLSLQLGSLTINHEKL
jgi:hypothetical protein